MTAQSKTVIKSYFETNDRPTQAEFGDLIDSYQDYSTAVTRLASAVTSAGSSLNVQTDGSGGFVLAAGGSGDVTGPSSSTKYGIATYKDTTGKIIENSPVTITSAGAASGFVDITATGKITGSAAAFSDNVSANSIFSNTDITASGAVNARVIKALGSDGITLKDSSGVQIAQMGAGGGDNVTFNGAVIISGLATFNQAVNVSGSASFSRDVAVSGKLTGGLFGYRSINAATTCSLGDSGITITCLASATTTVQLRDQATLYPLGFNVRIRNRHSTLVWVTSQANDSIIGPGNKIATKDRDALFEVISVSGSAHQIYGSGTLT